MQQLKTIQDWLTWAESRFIEAEVSFGHGTDNAWDEAVALVLTVLGLPLNSGQSILSDVVSEEQGQRIHSLVEERIEKRVPLSYLTHQGWFMGLPFYVDQRVLVPRSPFGEWIANAFSPWMDEQTVNRICEIGTGSGCMAIAAALVFKKAQVDAIDVDEEALCVARKNVEQYELTERVTLIQSDLFANVPAVKYDIIMSNPPYVGDEEMQTLPAEYLAEPHHALHAEENGLALVETILYRAAAYLTEHGILVVEVGNSMDALQARYPDVPFIWLEQEFGGHGLFLLDHDMLCTYFSAKGDTRGR